MDPRIEAALNAPLRAGASASKIAAPKARVPKGYGGLLGTGPIGTTCNACRACQPTGSDYRDWICNKPKRAWERGTFINRHSKSCGLFEPREPRR